jgi:hypothetical protein
MTNPWLIFLLGIVTGALSVPVFVTLILGWAAKGDPVANSDPERDSGATHHFTTPTTNERKTHD